MDEIGLNKWSAAIFAYNVAETINACIDAVRAQRPQSPFPIYVLVNGSRDRTEELVLAYAARHKSVVPVIIPLADKANAWNVYVQEAAPLADVHFFVDGDTYPLPNAFAALARALKVAPLARAMGALPAAGRDRVEWSRRMMAFGRLAGCLYALRGTYVAKLRHEAVRMPVGLIGEDLFLSCLVKERFDAHALVASSSFLGFAADARFHFRSLSPRRPSDWLTYGRRLVRYRVRDYQLALLLSRTRPPGAEWIPSDVAAMYRESHSLPRLRWTGRSTPFDMLAIRRIRRAARGKS
jgi:glycosyltransferase involved in cell wall biosynthesis